MPGLLDDTQLRLFALKDMNLSYEELLDRVVAAEHAYERMLSKNEELIARFDSYITENPRIGRKFIYLLLAEFKELVARAKIEEVKKHNLKRGKHAVESKHSQPGGSREKREKIRDLWRSGKYKTKVSCAEKEHDTVGIAYGTAIKALRNIPKN